MARCPETIDGRHSAPTWSGRCLFCRAVIARPRHQQRYARTATQREIERALRARPQSGPVDELGRQES